MVRERSLEEVREVEERRLRMVVIERMGSETASQSRRRWKEGRKGTDLVVRWLRRWEKKTILELSEGGEGGR